MQPSGVSAESAYGTGCAVKQRGAALPMQANERFDEDKIRNPAQPSYDLIGRNEAAMVERDQQREP